jgi:tripartite-type tricarboxylate transporter receptor subunit TctC
LPSLPNVPTANEQGMQFEASTWFGFFVPKATSAAIIKRLHDATVAVMETPWVQEQLAKNGTYVVGARTPLDDLFRKHHRPRDRKNAGPLIEAGMSVD